MFILIAVRVGICLSANNCFIWADRQIGMRWNALKVCSISHDLEKTRSQQRAEWVLVTMTHAESVGLKETLEQLLYMSHLKYLGSSQLMLLDKVSFR